MLNPKIILMLKAPILGHVKTRLAAILGQQEACRIYRCLVATQLEQIPETWPTEICFDPPEELGMMQDWLGTNYSYLPQSSGNLGQRLQAAAQLHFNFTTQPLIFIGGDCPYLNTDLLVKAQDLLLTNPVVIGPSVDGGYYLLALRHAAPELFQDIKWSTAQVLAQTLEHCKKLNLTYALLPELEDIDEPQHWKTYLDSVPLV